MYGNLFFTYKEGTVKITGAYSQVFIEVVEEDFNVLDSLSHIIIIMPAIAIEIVGKFFIEFCPVFFFLLELSFSQLPGRPEAEWKFLFYGELFQQLPRVAVIGRRTFPDPFTVGLEAAAAFGVRNEAIV